MAGVSLNLGPGANIWFSDKFGLSINGSGKWLLNHGDNLYNSNHFQYSAALMYRFVEYDDDNDGIINKLDECPKVFGVEKNDGRPEVTEIIEIDSDGDSVFGSVDNCPNTPGIESNNGCPYKAPTPNTSIEGRDTDMNNLSRKILFDSSNYNFKQEAYPVLLEIVQTMKLYPNSVFKIEGHTDSSGSYAYNIRLSINRANSVRNYLIDSGIPVENIITEAFGETKPKASNLLIEGRKLNRRVEVIRVN